MKWLCNEIGIARFEYMQADHHHIAATRRNGPAMQSLTGEFDSRNIHSISRRPEQ